MSTSPGRNRADRSPEETAPSGILQPRRPEERADGSARWTQELCERGRTRQEPVTGWIGCGCLAAVGLLGGIITLLLSILALIGGEAGAFARRLIEGEEVVGPGMSSGEIWGRLIAPSLVLIAIGIPLVIQGVREWRRQRGSI